MTDFSELFRASKAQPIHYKGNVLVLSDKFPVENGDILVASIEKSNSDCRQGLCIDITGSCEFEGKLIKQGKGIRMIFWSDTAPEEIKLKVITKKDFVRVYNIWEKTSRYPIGGPNGETVMKESKSLDYGRYGSAMIVEEIENGRRYRCNDWHPDENFDDIVFTIQKLRG